MEALPRWAAWSVAALLSCAWSAGCGLYDKADSDSDAPLTASSSCRTRAERCNARDDDCDGIIDERADSACGLAHAAGSCVRGRCEIERCSEGFLDCNNIMSDGCEAKDECRPASADSGAEAAPAESMTAGTASARDASVSSPPVTTAQAAQGGQRSEPAPDEADGGDNTDVSGSGNDAGASCAANSCDSCVGEADQAACACKAAAPTGQGPECDACVCDACPEALAACTGTDDDKWNTLCGAVLACFGESVQAGLCSGDDSDCFQNGDGPCASEFRAAFELGWICTADPVRTPCGALTRVRLDCYRNQCAAVCKA